MAEFLAGHPVYSHCNPAAFGLKVVSDTGNEFPLIQRMVFALAFGHRKRVVTSGRGKTALRFHFKISVTVNSQSWEHGTAKHERTT